MISINHKYLSVKQEKQPEATEVSLVSCFHVLLPSNNGGGGGGAPKPAIIRLLFI